MTDSFRFSRTRGAPAAQPQGAALLLDQGSHACKASIVDPDGRVVSAHSVRVAATTDANDEDRVEYEPQALITAMREAIATAIAELPPDAPEISAAGLATQRSTIACWDEHTGEPLSPIISWQDRRAADWLASLAPDPDAIRQITGLVPSAHYGASKLHWCLENLPEVARALREKRLRMGPVSSYLLYALLAQRPCVVDPANASRTLLWDVTRRDWSPKLLELFDIPGACLPDCVPSRHDFGQLAGDLPPIPLCVCTGDQAAALFAWGEPDSDTLYVNIGTGAFVQRACADSPPAAPGLLQSVAWQDADRTLSVLEGTVNGAGSAVTWLAAQAGVSEDNLFEQCERWLEEIDAPPLFINGVGGLGAPFWNPHCPREFLGLDDASEGDTLPARMVAVIESIVFLLMANIEAMETAAGPARRILVSGGLSQLDGLCGRLAGLSGRSVERAADIEATAAGLGWLLTGKGSAGEISRRFDARSDTRLSLRYREWLERLPRH